MALDSPPRELLRELVREESGSIPGAPGKEVDVDYGVFDGNAFMADRYAAMRGLAELERAGLVSVDRHSGRKARVTILPAPRPLGRE